MGGGVVAIKKIVRVGRICAMPEAGVGNVGPRSDCVDLKLFPFNSRECVVAFPQSIGTALLCDHDNICFDQTTKYNQMGGTHCRALPNYPREKIKHYKYQFFLVFYSSFEGTFNISRFITSSTCFAMSIKQRLAMGSNDAVHSKSMQIASNRIDICPCHD